jgi:hypothetical protein
VRWSCAIVVLVTAGACSFPHGQLSDASPDTPPDVPSAKDGDGDGVLDEMDNCPSVANANQRDHDGDKHGDPCDGCPHLADATDPDADADGVGDACDPRPMLAGDEIALWEPFDDAVLPSSYVRMGIGSANSGGVTQNNTNGESYLLLPNVFVHPYVATSFEVEGVNGASARGGTCSSMDSTTGQYYCCMVKASGPTLGASSYGPVTSFHNLPWSGSFAVGTKVDMSQNEVGDHDCQQGALTTTTQLGSTNGKVGLFLESAAATYDYVFVVEIGN